MIEPRRLRERPAGSNRRAGRYLKDFVYGAVDGTITTFAVVSGVAGANLSPRVVVILGTANLIADGFSMAASNFLGTRAERQSENLMRDAERHVASASNQVQSVVRTLADHGLQGQDVQAAASAVVADCLRFMSEPHGHRPQSDDTVNSAWSAALATFSAFLIVGCLPLLPFLAGALLSMPVAAPFMWSGVMTAAAFFLIGGIKSRFVGEHWIWGGTSTLTVGAAAAGLAYMVGAWVGGLGA